MLRILTMTFWKSLFNKKPTAEPPELKKQEVKPKPKQVSSLVRSELNLEKNSVFTVTTYRGESREIITTEKNPRGEVIEKQIIVGKTAEGKETGVLTTNHFKIYLALIELWEKAGRPLNEPIHFTGYKLIKRLNLADTGEAYKRTKRWLYGLRQIPIEFIHSFYVPEQGSFTSLEPFTIISHLRMYERKKVGKAQKTRGYGEFQFDRYILQNLIGNYVHPLRLDIINSFKKHKDLAILLYIYIDRNLAFKEKFEINLKNLFDNLDLSQNYVKYPSQRKMVIEPVLEELKSKPLSTGTLTYCKVQKTKDDKDYKLVCRKKPNTAIKGSESSAETKLPDGSIENPEKEKTAQIEAHKAKLDADQKAELREQAIQRLKQQGAKEEFINEFAIQAQENEILKETISR